MKVYMISPSGPCNGVKYSLKNTLEKLNNCKHPVVILGSIIHNKFVSDALVNKGIDKVIKEENIYDEINNITDSTVIINSAGLDSISIETLKNNNNDIIDSTCPIVKEIHQEIINKKEEKTILYIGDKNHFETKAALKENNSIILIDEDYNLDNLDKDTPYFLTGQTTFNYLKREELTNKLKKYFSDLELSKVCCKATLERQEVLNNYKNNKNSLFIVVGDYHSSNTNKLKDILTNFNPESKVILVDSIDKLIDEYRRYDNIYITSGASTPNAITNEIKEFFTLNKNAISNLGDDDYMKL